MSEIIFPNGFGRVYSTVKHGQKVGLTLSDDCDAQVVWDFEDSHIQSLYHSAMLGMSVSHLKYGKLNMSQIPHLLFSATDAFFCALNKRGKDVSGKKVRLARQNGGTILLSQLLKEKAATCMEKNALLVNFLSEKLRINASLFASRVYQAKGFGHAWAYVCFEGVHCFVDAYCASVASDGKRYSSFYLVEQKEIEWAMFQAQGGKPAVFNLKAAVLQNRVSVRLGFGPMHLH